VSDKWTGAALLLAGLQLARFAFMRVAAPPMPRVGAHELDLLVAYEAQKSNQVVPLKQLSAAKGMPVDQVAEWMRKRKEREAQTTRRNDVAACAWQAACYLGSFVAASSCFTAARTCPTENPKDAAVYVLALSLHLVIVHAASQHRAAHRVTVELVARCISCLGPFSYVVVMYHDGSDVLLDCARLAHHAKLRTTSQVLFWLFVLSWFVGRLYLFPVALAQAWTTGARFVGSALVLWALDALGTGEILRTVKRAYWTGLGDDTAEVPTGDSDSYDSDASLSSALREDDDRRPPPPAEKKPAVKKRA